LKLHIICNPRRIEKAGKLERLDVTGKNRMRSERDTVSKRLCLKLDFLKKILVIEPLHMHFMRILRWPILIFYRN
jgi:predicted metalloprotease